RHRADLAPMVARGALHVHPWRRGAVHPLRIARRHPAVAPRLCARYRSCDRLCGAGLSHHARPADGAPIRFPAKRGVTRSGRAPRGGETGVTFARNFISERQLRRATMWMRGVGVAIGLTFGLATVLGISATAGAQAQVKLAVGGPITGGSAAFG